MLRLPGAEDDRVICCHCRPLAEKDRFHRITCLERLEFRADGSIAPVLLTAEGVPAHPAH